MVNKLLMFFAYVIFFMLALMYFTPKTNLYYMLEKELVKHELIISDEKVSDKGFVLSLENAVIYMKDIESAQIKELDVKIFALYNAINVTDIKLSEVAGSFIPVKINNVDIRYSVINPLNIVIKAQGDFGEASGVVNILEKQLHLNVTPSEIMKKRYRNTMRQLKKQEDGSYSYDKTF